MVSPELPDLFLKYHYADARDLAKALLSLDAAVLVFSLTCSMVFSDRMAGRGSARRPAQVAMIGAWSAFLVAMAIAGLAVWGLALAAGRALRGGDFAGLAMRADALLLGAGLLFLGGLGALVAAAVLSMRLGEADRKAPGQT